MKSTDDDEARLYRLAMRMMLVFCVGSALLVAGHFLSLEFRGEGLLSVKTVQVTGVGVAFYLLVYYGYRSDYAERREQIDHRAADLGREANDAGGKA